MKHQSAVHMRLHRHQDTEQSQAAVGEITSGGNEPNKNIKCICIFAAVFGLVILARDKADLFVFGFFYCNIILFTKELQR